MSVINVNKNNFKEEVIESKKTCAFGFLGNMVRTVQDGRSYSRGDSPERPDIKVCKINVDRTR